MPFRSEKQRRYLWKHEPKIAREWTDEYGSKPQPKKKAEGGTIRKRHATGRNTAYELADFLKAGDRVTSQDIKRAQTVLKGKSKNEWKALQITLEKQKKGRALLDAHKKTPSYSKGKEKAKEHKEKITKLGKKALGYVDGWLGKKKGGITSVPFLRGRSGSGNIKAWRGKEGWKEAQRLKKKLTVTPADVMGLKKKLTVSDKLKMQDRGVINKKTGRLFPEHERALKSLSKKELNQLIKTGQNPRSRPSKPGFGLSKNQWKKNKKTTTQEGKYFRDRGFKKGGSIKKNGPVRPIHIPWDSQKKKQAGGLARRPKPDTKHNPHMEPYHGSYISGKVDGKMLSNPSLRKYYKGLI